MKSIQRKLAEITEDRRAAYLWPTKEAAQAIGMVPNKVGTWWLANRAKLLNLARLFPAETFYEFAAIAAEASEQREEIQ